MSELEFSVTKEWAAFAEKNPNVQIPEFAKDSEGQMYMRLPGRNVIYKVVSQDARGNQTYACNDCDSEIMAKTIASPVWDGPIPCSGSGRVESKNVPYCPNCEEDIGK